MHFCPYEPARGKWVLTCKKYLDRVSFLKNYLRLNFTEESNVHHFTGFSGKLNFGIVFQIVAQLSGEHIGKTINFSREGLSQLSWWKDSLLQCPENHYIMTCQFYWETVSRKKSNIGDETQLYRAFDFYQCCELKHVIHSFFSFTFKAIEAMRTQFLESVYNLCKKFFHIT